MCFGPKSTISIPILQYIIHYNILVPSSADSHSQSLTGINQLKLHIIVGTVLVLFPQPLVREGSLRVLVQRPHVAVVREVVQVVVQLLHILSMVSLPSTQPQQQGETGNMMHADVVREAVKLLHILPMVSLPST